MNNEKLYIKNEKGRYEEYRVPEEPFDNRLFRRVKHGRHVTYEPVSMLVNNDLGEGVWVVVRNKHCKSMGNAEYLYERFMCMKASDIQEVSLAQLGGMTRLAEHLSQHWDELPRVNCSVYDLCYAIVGLLWRYDKEKD